MMHCSELDGGALINTGKKLGGLTPREQEILRDLEQRGIHQIEVNRARRETPEPTFVEMGTRIIRLLSRR